MKLLTILVVVTTAAAASVDRQCKPATYRCEADQRGWDVCNTQGDWIYAGRCPSGTVCKFNKENGSPYCLPRRNIQESDESNDDDSHEQL